MLVNINLLKFDPKHISTVMWSVTDKNMPVMLAVLLPPKNGKNVLVFPNYAKNVLAQSIKAY